MDNVGAHRLPYIYMSFISWPRGHKKLFYLLFIRCFEYPTKIFLVDSHQRNLVNQFMRRGEIRTEQITNEILTFFQTHMLQKNKTKQTNLTYFQFFLSDDNFFLSVFIYLYLCEYQRGLCLSYKKPLP